MPRWINSTQVCFRMLPHPRIPVTTRITFWARGSRPLILHFVLAFRETCLQWSSHSTSQRPWNYDRTNITSTRRLCSLKQHEHDVDPDSGTIGINIFIFASYSSFRVFLPKSEGKNNRPSRYPLREPVFLAPKINQPLSKKSDNQKKAWYHSWKPFSSSPAF